MLFILLGIWTVPNDFYDTSFAPWILIREVFSNNLFEVILVVAGTCIRELIVEDVLRNDSGDFISGFNICSAFKVSL